MFRKKQLYKKPVALFFTAILLVQQFSPVAAFALTSGPAQPEMQKFEPAGTGDMVDLFSGDMKYNIPLMDVGGYPLNLSYHSGSGMEDEASWVGVGWSLNPGSVNRTLRGLPDDFNGVDKIKKIYQRKKFHKVGGSVMIKGTLFGIEAGSGSLKLGIFKDNYYGIGAEVGASVGFDLAKCSGGYLNAGLNLDLSSNTRNGVEVKPSLSLGTHFDFGRENNQVGLAGSLAYNTRAGLEQMNLGLSFTPSFHSQIDIGVGSYTQYFGTTYIPEIINKTHSMGYTANIDLGPEYLGTYVGLGAEGYSFEQENAEPAPNVPAYGYLNYTAGRHKTDVLLDFNREKDGVYIPGAPAIGQPVATQDFFTATSQAGSEQFRPFFNGNYIVYDRLNGNTTSNDSRGFTLGVGSNFQVGGRKDVISGNASTAKWINGNYYLSAAEAGSFSLPLEPVYFKQVGEATGSASTAPFLDQIGNDNPVAVSITPQNDVSGNYAVAKAKLTSPGVADVNVSSPIQRSTRDSRNFLFSYLTADQASKYGLDKMINGSIPRVDVTVHKSHHISEITVTDDAGKRMIYGIPVYNTLQAAVNFSVAHPSNSETLNTARHTGLITYNPQDNSTSNTQGRDNLCSRTETPPYATSYLLTGILSPDYVDLTGNGISDDDPGTAIKFSYTKLDNKYKWRAPYETAKASYNEGFFSDPKDDKASYEYGEKEIWYVKSIESKTMIAQFFTYERKDGLGVTDENGGRPTSAILQKLDSIRLFSKADYQKNGANAIPIKVVHFEYDYSLYPGVPNNLGDRDPVDPGNPDSEDRNSAKGKLTLKKVYFTFGTNLRGVSNPYLFEYDTRLINDESIEGLPQSTDLLEAVDQYTQHQTDRWGTYKQSFYNRLIDGNGVINNAEFPYSLQRTDNGDYDERALADRFVSKWQLNKITTPAGGTINIEYEADDYGYVQNKRAMQMCFVKGLSSVSGDGTGIISGLNTANTITVAIPVAIPGNDIATFKKEYLDGVQNIFYKLYVDVDNRGHYEYINGYAAIDYSEDRAADFKFLGDDPHLVQIPIVMEPDGYNPMAEGAWQMLKDDLPQYAYDGYDNSDVSSDFDAAIQSLAQAFKNFKELGQSFTASAVKRHFADKIDLSKSMVRLDNPDRKKIGGGARVHKISLSDEWQTMADNGKTAVYAQIYDYTMQATDGSTISSGVASYEPSIGNEENPFHQPVNYTEKGNWTHDKYHFIEMPYCESYFPAPAVGYSRVKVTNIGSSYSDPSKAIPGTGYIVNEFYTAKDFPTLVEYTPLASVTKTHDLTVKLFASNYISKVVTSQGFKVELNDMHGKPKSVKVYDEKSSLVTSTEYFYNVVDDDSRQREASNNPFVFTSLISQNDNSEQKRLNNKVLAMDKNGNIDPHGKIIGTDIDFVADVRESLNDNTQTGLGIYAGLAQLLILPFPYFYVNVNDVSTIDDYNSVATVKVIQKYGILKKVKTTKNGSSIISENMVWDAQTGQVVLSRTQNEFDDFVYAINYPAYMAYDRMGGAFQNTGIYFPYVAFAPNGIITGLNDYLVPGDELCGMPGTANGIKGWVIQSSDGQLHLIDANGQYINISGAYLLTRSGRRNLLSASAGSVVCLQNPMVTVGSYYRINPDVTKKIIDGKAVTYKDEWAVKGDMVPVVHYQPDTTCPAISPSCFNRFFLSDLGYFNARIPGSTRRQILSTINDSTYGWSNSVKFLLGCDPAAFGSEAHYYVHNPHVRLKVVGGFPPRWSNYYYLQAGDTAQLGQYQIVFDYVSNAFNDSANSSSPTPFSGIANGSSYLNQFIIVPGEDCSYILKKVSNCHIPLDTVITGDSLNSYCSYTDYLRFHFARSVITTYTCSDPTSHIINPYYSGMLGNWRADSSFAYGTSRVQEASIRQSGYYKFYEPFWVFNESGTMQDNSGHGTWIWSHRPVYFDWAGNEIENVDALQRFSAAIFGYNLTSPVAVASNARNHEIAYDGFEDYYFGSQAYLGMICAPKRQLDFQLGTELCTSQACIAAGVAHTGNYSLNLKGNVAFTVQAGSASAQTTFWNYDALGHYVWLPNELSKGWTPIAGKTYLLSLWVNDNQPGNPNVQNFDITVNGSSLSVSSRRATVVEGWKKLDLMIPLTSSSFPLNITLASSDNNLYIDDIRLMPYDGEMKSFVYDDKSMRLSAQLDENNFAVLYEYDDEGTLVRVKKETERGVMTLKENRQSNRKYRTP